MSRISHSAGTAFAHVFLRSLVAALTSIVIASSTSAPSAAQGAPICSRFDSGADGFGPCTDAPNVTVTTVTDNGGITNTDAYLKVTDLSNASRVCSSDPKYVGNWLEKMNGCGQLCFDFKVFSSGYPPSPITPSISILGGGGRATFYAGFQVAVGDLSWHRNICAPIMDGASPPTSTGGHWTITGASWHQIITNVTMVQLPIDFTSQPSEVVGYDNICMTPGNCPDTKKPPEIKGCLNTMKVGVKCNGDGTYTVTLSGSGAPGDIITMTAQTTGVTVTPPQQNGAPTTTWTISGATPGQTVTLIANATKTGGGKESGTDQCCVGEITLVAPECPKETPVDVSIKKTGGTTPVQEPFYSFALEISNNGAPFTGANAIIVTDVLPPGMTFTNVSAAPPGDWSCPASVPAGGTLTCTYIGAGPTGSGVIGTITISATAGGTAPYPPITNCASVGTTGVTDTVADNNNACVTVSKPGQVGEIIFKKEAVYLGPILLPSLIYPVAVTCGTNTTTLNLVPGVNQSIGNIPVGTSCSYTETPPPPPPGVCPQNKTPQWATAYVPPSPQQISTTPTNVLITNTLTCETPQEITPVSLTCDPRTTERKGDVCACRFENMVRTSSSMCGCREGSNFIAGRGCVPRIACRGGLIPNAAGTDCVCRTGLVLRQGKCVEPVSCRAPAKLNRAGTGCICPEGMTKRGNTCVEQRTPQITIPRGVPGIGFPGGGGDKRGPQGGGGEGPRGVR